MPLPTQQYNRQGLAELIEILFADNETQDIMPADLRQALLAMVQSVLVKPSDPYMLGVGNSARTGLKFVRHLTRAEEEYGYAVREELDPNTVCLGTICYSAFAPTPAEKVTVMVYHPDQTNQEWLVWPDGDYETTGRLKVAGKWVPMDSAEAASAFMRSFTPNDPAGFKLGEVVKYLDENGQTQFVEALIELRRVDYPGGYPPPTGRSDSAVWKPVSPPGSSTALYQRVLLTQARELMAEEAVWPGRYYLLTPDPVVGGPDEEPQPTNGMDGPILCHGGFDGVTFGPDAVRQNSDGTYTRGQLTLAENIFVFTPDAGGGLSDRNVVCRTPAGMVAYDTVLEAFQNGEKSIEVNKTLSYVDGNLEVYADFIFGNGSQIISGGGYTLILAKSQDNPISLFNLSLNGNNLMRSYGNARINLHNRSSLRGYRFNSGDTVHVYDSSRIFDCVAANGAVGCKVYLYDSATASNIPATVEIVDLRPKDFLRADLHLPALYAVSRFNTVYRGNDIVFAGAIAGTFGNIQLCHTVDITTSVTIGAGTHLNGNLYALGMSGQGVVNFNGYNRISNIIIAGGLVQFLGNNPAIDFQTVDGNYFQNVRLFCGPNRRVYLNDVFLEYNGTDPNFTMFSGGGTFILSGRTTLPGNVLIEAGTTVTVASTSAPVGGGGALAANSVTNEYLGTDVKVGSLAALVTSVKTSVVAAINSLSGLITNLRSDVGTLASLTTTAKGNLVAAINEVNAKSSGGAGAPDTSNTPTFTTLVWAADLTLNVANKNVYNAQLTLEGNTTVAFSNVPNGASGTLVVKQDAAGTRALVLPSNSRPAGALAINSQPHGSSLVGFIYTGTEFLWTVRPL